MGKTLISKMLFPKMINFCIHKGYIPIVLLIYMITIISIVYINTCTHNFYINISKNDNDNVNLSSIRICCLILTAPKYFLTYAKSVNETWGSRCDRHFFISENSKENLTTEEINLIKRLPIAPIDDIKIGYGHLTQKSTLAFLFAYENYINDFQWFVKADDDTYLIIEHLKAFLIQQDPSQPVTFGYNFKVHVPKGYHSGGASYVLSQESLRRFYEIHHDRHTSCVKDGGMEDIEIALCLREKGVYPGKSLDKQNKELFHPLSFKDHFNGIFPNWLQLYAENSPKDNYNCCSDQTISFHYTSPEEQYLMDFLLYRVRSIPNINLKFIQNNYK